jgi:hypothetical protein
MFKELGTQMISGISRIQVYSVTAAQTCLVFVERDSGIHRI